MPFLRKNIRLSPGNYAGKRAYFVTVCCKNRRPVFRNAGAVSLALHILRELSIRHEFAVHAYCFMPDHAHLLVEGLSPTSNLLEFVARFKQQSAFAYRREFGGVLWQPKAYDHVLRRADAMEDVAWYIWLNPVRKGLSREAWDYRFSGSYTLPWGRRLTTASSWMPPWKAQAERQTEERMPG